MLTDGNIPELVESIDVDSLRVYAPKSVVFLCGGPVDATSTTYKSLRDAFLRFAYDEPFKKYNVLLAEDLNGFFPNGQYDNILKLESDIAQISDLVVLFSESFGSAAELGAFAMVEQIATNLLVVVDDQHYNHNSFIKLGPLKKLENSYGEYAICVLNRSDINIASIANVTQLNLDVFKQRINSAIMTRLRQIEAQSHTSFSRSNDGHVMKLIVGIIQHYGSLKLDEIKFCLECIGIMQSESRIADFLLCSGFAQWIVKDKRGLSTYYSALSGRSAIKYNLVEKTKVKSRDRWKTDIREFWKEVEPDRFSSISYAIGMPSR